MAVALCLLAYLFVPPINKLINDIVKMFQTGNFSAIRTFIAQYGLWAMLISSLLMIFQSLAAPLPAFFITLTNANLFDWLQGCILSFVCSMLGAAMCFYIARILGRDVVGKICTKGALKQIEDFFAKYGKPIALLLVIAAILILDRIYGWSDYLGNVENLQFLLEIVRENLLEAVLIYSLLTIVGCVVLALPGVTFAVFAGILFGPWLGTFVCLMATTAGAILAFLVGRFFLRDSIKPLVMKNKWMKKVLFDDAGRSDIVVLMITRLVPVFPYNLQNFAYGITDIKLTAYSVYTFLFMLPGVVMFTIGSAGFTADGNRWPYFTAAGVLLVLVFLMGWFVKKKYLEASASEVK